MNDIVYQYMLATAKVTELNFTKLNSPNNYNL